MEGLVLVLIKKVALKAKSCIVVIFLFFGLPGGVLFSLLVLN